ADGLTTTWELESKRTTLGHYPSSGGLPPLRLKFRKSEKIAWKFIAIAGQRDAVGRVERREDSEKERRAEGSTLHEQPRRDLAARRFARDKSRRGRSPQKSGKWLRSESLRASGSEWSIQKTVC